MLREQWKLRKSVLVHGESNCHYLNQEFVQDTRNLKHLLDVLMVLVSPLLSCPHCFVLSEEAVIAQIPLLKCKAKYAAKGQFDTLVV